MPIWEAWWTADGAEHEDVSVSICSRRRGSNCLICRDFRATWALSDQRFAVLFTRLIGVCVPSCTPASGRRLR